MRGGGERWAGADVTTAFSLTRPSDGRSAAQSEAVSQNQRRHSAGTSRVIPVMLPDAVFFFFRPLCRKVERRRKVFRRLAHLRNNVLTIARQVQFLFCPFFFYDQKCFRFVSGKDFPANISQWCQILKTVFSFYSTFGIKYLEQSQRNAFLKGIWQHVSLCENASPH